jgi:dTDP-L-rhamnose 4-epimerase
MKILVTGGAGFIGSHITDSLIDRGYEVTVLDNLSGTEKKIPEYMNKRAKFIHGDIRALDSLETLVSSHEAIFHEAASVGIAQSNYQISDFVDNNCLGTAKLLQAIVDSKIKPKLILSCSNTTYGEGYYSCHEHGIFHPEIRTSEQIEKFGFQPVCLQCKKAAKPVPTPELAELKCNSIYALTKKFQEESSIMLGRFYNFPVVLLKYFNVFGPRQSLSNPYTGVSAIFMNRIKSGNIPIIYEDGQQTRDFISVHDVVRANILALEKSEADYQIFNIGSGIPLTIKSLAEKIFRLHGKEPMMEINYKFRKGDIRHCISDISKANSILGWSPKISFDRGLSEIYEWAKMQESRDDFNKANQELKEKGLI